MCGQDVKGKLLEFRDFCLFGPLLVPKYTKQYLTHSRHSINISGKESWILPGRQTSNRYLSKNCPRHTHLFACVRLAFKRATSTGTSLKVHWSRYCTSKARSMGSIPYWGTKIPYAMQHTTIHPRKQTNNTKTTLDSTDILPTGNYRDKGRELASSLKGQKHSGADEKQQVQPYESSQVDGLPCDTRFLYFYKSTRNVPHLIHFCLLAIRCSFVDNKFSSFLLIRWYHFICGCCSVFGSAGP